MSDSKSAAVKEVQARLNNPAAMTASKKVHDYLQAQQRRQVTLLIF